MQNIQTERLTLRPFQLSDAPRVRALAGTYEIASVCGNIPHPYPEGVAEAWISTHEDSSSRGDAYALAIEITGWLAGCVGLTRSEKGEFELGYWLGEDYRDRGFASEAVRAVLAFAFDELGVPYVRARHVADNRASCRVLAKMGFLGTGRSRKYHAVRQSEVEMIHVILLRDAFIRDDSAVKQVYKAA
jgi:ribosomal-protein-alanine N-acetyltransferase